MPKRQPAKAQKGERNPRAKLTAQMVAEIRGMGHAGMKQAAIQAMLPVRVSIATIRSLVLAGLEAVPRV